MDQKLLALVDVDVIVKLGAWNVLDRFSETATQAGLHPSALVVAIYSAKSRIGKGRFENNPILALQVDAFANSAHLLRPTYEELALAASFEAEAQALNLEFDVGESQLAAIMTLRGCAYMMTGDKRAIHALAHHSFQACWGRVLCLEQVVWSLVLCVGAATLKALVCSVSKVDISVSNCFSCRIPGAADSEIISALSSYIRHLKSESGEVLASTYLGWPVAP